MAMEETPEKEPQFSAYTDVKSIADKLSLAYFSEWLEMINLEQSTVNIRHSHTAASDIKDQIKEEGL